MKFLLNAEISVFFLMEGVDVKYIQFHRREYEIYSISPKRLLKKITKEI